MCYIRNFFDFLLKTVQLLNLLRNTTHKKQELNNYHSNYLTLTFYSILLFKKLCPIQSSDLYDNPAATSSNATYQLIVFLFQKYQAALN